MSSQKWKSMRASVGEVWTKKQGQGAGCIVITHVCNSRHGIMYKACSLNGRKKAHTIKHNALFHYWDRLSNNG